MRPNGVLSSRTGVLYHESTNEWSCQWLGRAKKSEWGNCCVTEKGVAAVDRALSIVGAIGNARRPLTLSETAAATGLYKSTVLRLLASLERARFVTRDRDGRYRLGSTIYRLAGTFEHSAVLENEVAPALQRIVDETGESAGYFVREGSERLCLIRVDSPQPLRHNIAVGVLRPLGLGASGRVLKLFENGAAQANRRELAALPVVVLGDDVPDLAAIAMPIFGSGGATLGVISVSGPLSRFDRRLVDKVKPLLREIAVTLTDRLGGDSTLFGWDP
jgi:DNA-binding IclR family transcriptional regulator